MNHAWKFADLVNEGARACLWGLRLALEHDVSSIGDCLPLIKLKNRVVDDNFFGLIVKDIFSFA